MACGLAAAPKVPAVSWAGAAISMIKVIIVTTKEILCNDSMRVVV
jgi:hypothetical protein